MAKAKTSPVLAESTTLEHSALEQQVNQYNMLGNVYEPGLIDQMLATDPTIQMGWLGLSAAMAQAQVSLVKQGCKDEIYTFVYEMLFKRLGTRFQQVFLNALQALLYGVAPAEVTLDFKGGHWIYKDISARPVRGFNLYEIRKHPDHWWIEGNYSWFTTYGGLRTVQCGGPDEKDKALVWWPVFGQGLLGRSLLRPIVNEHIEKCEIRRLRGSALRKVLFGTPILHARQRREDESELNPKEVDAAKMALARAATGNASCLYLSEDFEKPDVLYAQSDGLGKSIEAENALDIQILMALGSSHLARGLLSSYGSQGAGELDQLTQDAIRGYFFQWFAEQFQSLIDWIVDINFGEQAHYPELSIVSPSMMTVPQLSRTLTQLVGAGLIRPCEADEQKLRELCRMPEQSGKFISNISNIQSSSSDDGVGIVGHYDPLKGDSRQDRDVEYSEVKNEL